MTGKFIINQNGEIEDTMTHITFDSFMEILIVLNGQSRQLKKLSEENEQLKQQNKQAIDLIFDGIMEMHDGKRDYAETLFNKAIKVIKNDT